MSLRVPLSADETARAEFTEIERRLRRLEKVTGRGAGDASRVTILGSSGAGTVNLKPITDRLDALEDYVSTLPTETYRDFGGVGTTSVHGLVPAPGVPEPPAGVAQHLLTESGEWGFPFRGLMDVVTTGDETSEGSDTLDVLGSLAVLGNVSAVDINCEEVIIPGDSYQLRSDLRGLVALGTPDFHTVEPQTVPPYDIVNILGGVHINGPLSCESIISNDLLLTGVLDGGTP